MIRAKTDYVKRQRREMAFWVANLMNATGNFSKRPMTVDRLVGDDKLQARRAEMRKRAAQKKKEQESRG